MCVILVLTNAQRFSFLQRQIAVASEASATPNADVDIHPRYYYSSSVCAHIQEEEEEEKKKQHILIGML